MTRIALVIDQPPEYRYRVATLEALAHVDPALEVDVVRTPEIVARLADYDGLFVGPGSPYDDLSAVLAVIRTARESGLPLVAT